MAGLISPHQDAVQRLIEIPGLGVDAAQQIIAEVGPTAASFSSAKSLSSWVGICPGDEESAGVNRSAFLAKGQPADATDPQPDGQRSSKGQKQRLRACLSSLRSATGT
jgi:hypothetical protein